MIVWPGLRRFLKRILQFGVLDSDGNSFTTTSTVRDSDGNSFTVTASVRDSDGNSFTVS